MNEIRIINKSTFLDKEIDVWGSIEHPLFRAKDVASWLAIKNVPDLVKRVDVDEVHRFNLGSLQGDTWFLTEDGLYEVLMQSRKPAAKQFKKGVKAILHELRKTGAYIVAKPEDTEEDIIARGLIAAKAALERKEQQLKELQAANEQQAATIGTQEKQLAKAAPKVEYYDQTLAAVNCITPTQIGNELGISARALNQKLAEIGVIYKQSGQWIFKGKYKEWNLGNSRTFNRILPDGRVIANTNLVWDQRGKRFILALFNNSFNVRAAIAEIKGDNSSNTNAATPALF